MPEKPKTSSGIEKPKVSTVESVQEQNIPSNTELRAGAEKLARAVTKAKELIEEANSSLKSGEDLMEQKVKEFIFFLQDGVTDKIGSAPTLSLDMGWAQKLIMEYFTDTEEFKSYLPFASKICNEFLEITDELRLSSITLSAFLNLAAQAQSGTTRVQVSITHPYSHLGMLLNNNVALEIDGHPGDFVGRGAKDSTIIVMGSVSDYAAVDLHSGRVIIDGDAGDYLARSLDGGRVVLNGDAGRLVAANMTDGVLDLHRSVMDFAKSAFSKNNKGKIFLHHPTEGQVLIYDGSQKGLFGRHLNYTKEAKKHFDIFTLRNSVIFAPR